MMAPREVVPVIIKQINPKSVLDVGCGIGTWLRAFEENGVQDYCGIDGAYVNRTQLQIPQEKFVAADLRKPFLLNRKFDLIISLEVAEHLPENCADNFVSSLVSHGDVIIFSAAVPGQGGQYHINEQWPEYWQEKFKSHGFYYHDIIREKIWTNEKIDWWYRQNIFLISREINPRPALALVHPELLNQKINNEQAYRESFLKGKQGIMISAMAFFNSLMVRLKKTFSK